MTVAELRELLRETYEAAYSVDGLPHDLSLRIDAALAEPPAPEWRFVDGKMEADLGDGWFGKVSAYDRRIAWSVHRPSDDGWAVGRAASLDEAMTAALAATKGER